MSDNKRSLNLLHTTLATLTNLVPLCLRHRTEGETEKRGRFLKQPFCPLLIQSLTRYSIVHERGKSAVNFASLRPALRSTLLPTSETHSLTLVV